MELEHIVPWGRSLHEYQGMFSLNQHDLGKTILGCADGPASFNAELTQAGGHVVSIDPIYQFGAAQIRSRIEDVYPHIIAEMEKNYDAYLWQHISSIEALGNTRMCAMEKFLVDYESGKAEGRYIDAALPTLPFDNHAFDLALCSHYLFLYSDFVDESEHLAGLLELCRVAGEVRVYPLLSLDGSRSKHLDAVVKSLKNRNIDVSLQAVTYQFQKGSDSMLVLKCL